MNNTTQTPCLDATLGRPSTDLTAEQKAEILAELLAWAQTDEGGSVGAMPKRGMDAIPEHFTEEDVREILELQGEMLSDCSYRERGEILVESWTAEVWQEHLDWMNEE